VNVTDALEVIRVRVQRARDRLVHAQASVEVVDESEWPSADHARSVILEAIVILDDTLDVVRREMAYLSMTGSLLHTKACEHCAQSMEMVDNRGRPRRFCSDSCRQAAYRIRTAQQHE
jgi:hypothetical protein